MRSMDIPVQNRRENYKPSESEESSLNFDYTKNEDFSFDVEPIKTENEYSSNNFRQPKNEELAFAPRYQAPRISPKISSSGNKKAIWTLAGLVFFLVLVFFFYRIYIKIFIIFIIH